MVRCRLLLCLIITLSSLAATQPTRVADINRVPLPNPSTNPDNFLSLAGRTFFMATRSDVGQEVFVTDGTQAGTTLFMDTVPGRFGHSRTLMRMGTRLVGVPASPGAGIFITDGTRAGTTVFGIGSTEIDDPVEFNGMIYFHGDGPDGRELWRTDGTAAGTTLFADLNPGPGDSRPQPLGVFNNRLIVAANDGQVYGLWATDGVQTSLLTVVNAFPPETFIAMPNYFLCSNRSGHVFHWSGSNLTTIAWIPNGGRRAEGLTELNGLVYFTSQDIYGTHLWVSDGTAGGTKNTGTKTTWPAYLTQYAGAVYFVGDDASIGRELMRITGQTVTTVADIEPGMTGSFPYGLCVANNRLFFHASTTAEGRELWHYDGTAVQMARAVRPGPASGTGNGLWSDGALVWFGGDDGLIGNEPWLSDGTTAGTRLVADVEPAPTGTLDANVSDLIGFNGACLFAADDGVLGVELWRSDGTGTGTTLVKDIAPGNASSSPTGFVIAETQAFFVANGADVWRTDGTALGTRQILAAQQVGDIVTLGDRAFIPATTTTGTELWESDGTAAGTTRIPGLGGSPGPGQIATVGDSVFYGGVDGELWVARGNPAVATLVKDINPNNPSGVGQLTAFGGRVFFAADDGVAGRELWESDGTPDGTKLHCDTIPGRGSGGPRYLLVSGDKLFFEANRGLWVTDGTPSGCKPVLAVPELNWSIPSASFGDGRVFVTSSTNATGNEPWISDGTAAGTQRLGDLSPGSGSGMSASPLATGDRYAWFGGRDSRDNRELWRTDGTPAGTQLVTEFVPGPTGGDPRGFVMVGGTLYFSASGDNAGTELWRLDPGASAQPVGVGCGQGLRSPRLSLGDPALGRAIRFGGFDSAIGATAYLYLSPGHIAPISLGSGCAVWLNPATLALVDVFSVSAASWTRTVGTVPTASALTGLRISAQAAFVGTPAPRGFELSQGVQATIGQ